MWRATSATGNGSPGTGADPRPNRMFNPLRQARRFDTGGTYVRRYVPELGDVEDAFVHEPWRAPRAAQPDGYPRADRRPLGARLMGGLQEDASCGASLRAGGLPTPRGRRRSRLAGMRPRRKPVVACSRDGALELGRRYWREVERASDGVLRLRAVGDETGLRLVGVGPVAPALRAARGGRRRRRRSLQIRDPRRSAGASPVGSITLSQSNSRAARALCGDRSGSFPRLGRTPALRTSSSAASTSCISRRYFRRLLREARG